MNEAAAPRPITVFRLNAVIKGTLEQRLPPVWVIGEISEWKPWSNGNIYFSLKDKRASVRCVMRNPLLFRIGVMPMFRRGGIARIRNRGRNRFRRRLSWIKLYDRASPRKVDVHIVHPRHLPRRLRNVRDARSAVQPTDAEPYLIFMSRCRRFGLCLGHAGSSILSIAEIARA